MGRILAGDAPLRGRAGLDMVVRPLDHQAAAEFWDLTDSRLALQVGAIVGGTPAYRREFVRNDSPAGLEDFDAWVVRAVLDPSSGTGFTDQLQQIAAHDDDIALVGLDQIYSR